MFVFAVWTQFQPNPATVVKTFASSSMAHRFAQEMRQQAILFGKPELSEDKEILKLKLQDPCLIMRWVNEQDVIWISRIIHDDTGEAVQLDDRF